MRQHELGANEASLDNADNWLIGGSINEFYCKSLLVIFKIDSIYLRFFYLMKYMYVRLSE